VGAKTPTVLPDLLARAAGARPDHDAVRCGGRSYTYDELNRASDALAHALTEAGVELRDRVGIHLPKRIETAAAVYAVMKAGAAYVPLDPRAPVARLALVATDCRIAALVTTPARAVGLVEAMGDHPPKFVVLVDDGTTPQPLSCRVIRFEEAVATGSAGPRPPLIQDDLAYILYTSGSTGVPKGVMLTHRNALSFVQWCFEEIGVGPDDRLSNHAPLHFDLSVFDLYVAAMAAVPVVLVPDEEAYFGSALLGLIRDEGITVWYSVPTALTLMARAASGPQDLAGLRTVVFAGEVFPTKHLRELQAMLPDGTPLWNLYGPTETNVCTYYRVRSLPDDDRTIPIGRACRNDEVFALTEQGTVAGVGEEGELYVRGPTVMKGYWGRPERTAEMLVRDPRPDAYGDPVYRTGDLVKLRPDGDYDFLGRRDHQIKSRGYRIELGEIEAALNAHPSLAEAVAVAVDHDEWGKAIVACVAVRGGQSVSVAEVKRHLAARVPRYMIPVRIDVLDQLPRTPNGKIDRRRLQEEAAREPIGA
jgi:L-proline---[L-prolyl-carrier protein] ligase